MSAGPLGTVQLVWGRKILEVEGSTLRDEAAGFRYVVVDLGAGDGRFVYRLARMHADWFCVAIESRSSRQTPLARGWSLSIGKPASLSHPGA
jgi:tRNA G46 methylase TrmB